MRNAATPSKLNYGTVTGAVALLEVAGANNQWFQGIRDFPATRNAVLTAGNGSLPAVMSKDEWIETEANLALRKIELGLPEPASPVHDLIARHHRDGYGAHHHFQLPGCNQEPLLQAMLDLGAKLNGGKVETARFKDGEAIPTAAGVFQCDLSRMMMPTDLNHRPFNLDYAGHDQWAKEQDGIGMSTVEQTLDLMLGALILFTRHTFMGGWIRCRNAYGSGRSLSVILNAGRGVNVSWTSHTIAIWSGGTLPEKFTNLEF